MLKNYFKIAFRSMLKNKISSFIIILSFAIGLACINIISTYVLYELSTDSFNLKKDRIYRLLADDAFNKGEVTKNILPSVPGIIKAKFPEIEDYCRTGFFRTKDVKAGKNEFSSPVNVLEVTPSFFNIFSFKLRIGSNPSKPGEVILTKKNAEKYFGKENPIGKKLIIEKKREKISYTVSGILRDISYNSHFKYDMISYLDIKDKKAGPAYLLLKPGVKPGIIEHEFSVARGNIPIVNNGTPGTYHLEPLSDIFFDTQNNWGENTGNISLVFTFLSIAILILVIASFNYLNLLKFKFKDELKSITIRKILGEREIAAFIPLYLEISISLLMGFIFSLAFTEILLNTFNKITTSNITLGFILQPKILLYYISVLLFLSIIFFFYINYISARYSPAEFLSSIKSYTKRRIPVFQIIQFVVSTSLITSALIIMLQINYIDTAKLGLERNVIEIRLPRNTGIKAESFKNEILKSSLVSGASVAEASPVLEHAEILLHYDAADKSKTYTPAVFWGDADYPSVLGLKLIAGSYFNPNANNNDNCIINESLAKKFGMSYPIGREVPGTNLIIIGMVKDFHFNSMKSHITPGYILCDNSGSNLLIKFKYDADNKGITHVKKCWNNSFKDFPFSYQTLGEHFDLMHRDTINIVKLISMFALIGILLSVLGLFSFSLITTKSRIKEISIRKILGSSVNNVVLLLLKDYLKWILLADLVSWLITYNIMAQWLQNFAYRIQLSWWIFALSGGITLMIALTTISFQAIKAAKGNPVKSLRYE